MNDCQDITTLKKLINSPSKPPYCIYSKEIVMAILFNFTGQFNEARKEIEKLKKNHKVKGFEETISTIERRLELT